MAEVSTGKGLDLKYQPGFAQIAWFCIIVLYAPIAVLVTFSFNENRSVMVWTQFSLDWYVKAWNNEGVQHAAWISLQVAFTAMVFSTIMATMAALVTTRTAPYRGMNFAIAIINQPLMVPEVVTAVATLSACSRSAGLDWADSIVKNLSRIFFIEIIDCKQDRFMQNQSN